MRKMKVSDMDEEQKEASSNRLGKLKLSCFRTDSGKKDEVFIAVQNDPERKFIRVKGKAYEKHEVLFYMKDKKGDKVTYKGCYWYKDEEEDFYDDVEEFLENGVVPNWAKKVEYVSGNIQNYLFGETDKVGRKIVNVDLPDFVYDGWDFDDSLECNYEGDEEEEVKGRPKKYRGREIG